MVNVLKQKTLKWRKCPQWKTIKKVRGTIKNSNLNAFVAIMLSMTVISSFYTFLIKRDWKIEIIKKKK